jgi:hypothetical protein
MCNRVKKPVFEAKIAKSINVYSQSRPFRDYNRRMTTVQPMTVREIRKAGTSMLGEWIAVQDAQGTYKVRCGDIELCTVNGKKTRKFRSLDVLRQALKEEIGVTEFRVQEEQT